MIQDRQPEDGTILEETSLVISVEGGQEIELYTCQSLSYEETREVEVRHGPGRKRSGGEGREIIARDVFKTPTYTFSMELDEPNHSLLINPDTDTETGRGEQPYFLIGTNKYYKLMDIPRFSVVQRFPAQSGNMKVKKLLKCRFTKNSGSIGVGEAAKVTVEGIAHDASGLF